MADVEVWGIEAQDGKVTSLRVRFKGTAERTISRDTALEWLAGGHSLITYTGPHHHGHRGQAIERVEIGESAYLRTDTKPTPSDDVQFSTGH